MNNLLFQNDVCVMSCITHKKPAIPNSLQVQAEGRFWKW